MFCVCRYLHMWPSMLTFLYVIFHDIIQEQQSETITTLTIPKSARQIRTNAEKQCIFLK